MTEQLKEHIKANKAIFEAWLGANETPNIGNGLIQPIIPEFSERFPEVNLTGNCKSCIGDMLIWALNGIKQDTNGKTNTGATRSRGQKS